MCTGSCSPARTRCSSDLPTPFPALGPAPPRRRGGARRAPGRLRCRDVRLVGQRRAVRPRAPWWRPARPRPWPEGCGSRRGRAPLHGPRTAVRVAAAGRSLTARAQALAVTAALAGDLEPGRDTKRFYAALRKVDGWQSLPPTIAIHRVLGTPDPFAYEEQWPVATTLLGARHRQRHGRGRRGDLHRGLGARPLPSLGRGQAGAAAAGRHRRTAWGGPAVSRPPSSLRAARPWWRRPPGPCGCGGDASSAGPWAIEVRDRGQEVTTSYAHVQRPACATGRPSSWASRSARSATSATCAGASWGSGSTPRGEGVHPCGAGELALHAAGGEEEEAGAQGPEVRVIPATSFRVATFNVLGSHLTAPRRGQAALRAGPPAHGARPGPIESSRRLGRRAQRVREPGGLGRRRATATGSCTARPRTTGSGRATAAATRSPGAPTPGPRWRPASSRCRGRSRCTCRS